MPPSSSNLDNWIQRITEKEMPIFGRTVQEVTSVSEDERSSAAHLGQVILKDASMTARVLRLANSPYYNFSSKRFSTISHAIMMLGFNTVRNMSLTVSLIDSLGPGINQKQLIRQMARSLHAAFQAEEIAKRIEGIDHEEVFIATLLFNIGNLAFWSAAGEEGNRLNEAMDKPDYDTQDAEREVLGFCLDDLSKGLAKSWGLSDVLQKTLNNPGEHIQQTQTILLSNKFAKAVENGWNSDEVKDLTKEIASVIDLSPKRTAELLEREALKATETTAYFGAKIVADIIPLPSSKKAEEDNDAVEIIPPDSEPDHQLQLQILQELTSIKKGDADLNLLIEMTLEGINRGVGMDNALFSLLTPDRKKLSIKQAIGKNNSWLRDQFKFDLASLNGRIWVQALKQNDPIFLKPDSKFNRWVTPDIQKIIKTDTFCLSPIVVKNKPIGLLYADRSNSKKEIDDSSFNNFALFAQQINMVLNRIV